MGHAEFPDVDLTLSRPVSDQRLLAEETFGLLMNVGTLGHIEHGAMLLRRLETFAIDVNSEAAEQIAFRALTVPNIRVGAVDLAVDDEPDYVVLELQAGMIPETVAEPTEDSYEWQSWTKIIANKQDYDDVEILDGSTYSALSPERLTHALAVMELLRDEIRGTQFEDKLANIDYDLGMSVSSRLKTKDTGEGATLLAEFQAGDYVEPMQCGRCGTGAVCEHGNPALFN